jgi:hypothetical protein
MDGWLYYSGENNLAYYENTVSFEEGSHGQKNIDAIRTALIEQDIFFMVSVVPNKRICRILATVDSSNDTEAKLDQQRILGEFNTPYLDCLPYWQQKHSLITAQIRTGTAMAPTRRTAIMHIYRLRPGASDKSRHRLAHTRIQRRPGKRWDSGFWEEISSPARNGERNLNDFHHDHYRNDALQTLVGGLWRFSSAGYAASAQQTLAISL